MADVIDIVRNGDYNGYFSWEESDNSAVIPYSDVEVRFFVRINEGQKGSVKEIFGDTEIIKGVSDYGFVTPRISVKVLSESIEKLGGAVSVIRLYK